MFWLFNDNRPWFRHKVYGFGAGLPMVWQGWAFMGLHVALIIGLAALLEDQPLALFVGILTAAILPLPIYASRTEGGWRWRWGGDK